LILEFDQLSIKRERGREGGGEISSLFIERERGRGRGGESSRYLGLAE
jgi:hypothetical protein